MRLPINPKANSPVVPSLRQGNRPRSWSTEQNFTSECLNFVKNKHPFFLPFHKQIRCRTLGWWLVPPLRPSPRCDGGKAPEGFFAQPNSHFLRKCSTPQPRDGNGFFPLLPSLHTGERSNWQDLGVPLPLHPSSFHLLEQ